MSGHPAAVIEKKIRSFDEKIRAFEVEACRLRSASERLQFSFLLRNGSAVNGAYAFVVEIRIVQVYRF